jgi:hypothetical protein
MVGIETEMRVESLAKDRAIFKKVSIGICFDKNAE